MNATPNPETSSATTRGSSSALAGSLADREPDGEDVRIVGRYALHQQIGSGGMATVHLGRLLGPAGFSRTVAVKRLHAQHAKDPEFVSMFLDEARLAARIRHPNVVSTLDVVALEGELFMVMDYVEGESLARLVAAARRRGERIPSNVSLAVMANVLYGLQGAHEARGERGEPLGIVHRDVSPQNILVDTQGVTRVVDFGVAKAAGRSQTTRNGQLKGKIAYMAPEQLLGHGVDARTDVFAASVVLWELLTGQRLFQGETQAATFCKILESNVEAPSAAGAETSPEIDAIVLKGLAHDPEQRWQSALDMAEALESATRNRPTQRDLGRWVRTWAEATFDSRARAVRDLERHSGVNELVRSRAPSARVSGPVEDSTATVRVAPASEPGLVRTDRAPRRVPRRSSETLVLAAAVASSVLAFLTLVILVVAVLDRARGAPAPAARAISEPKVAPALAEVAVFREQRESAALETGAEPSPPAKAGRGAKARPVRKPNCNPPFTLDQDDTRIPKLECL